MSSSIQMTDEISKAVQKTPNRVSLEFLESRIEDKQFFRPDFLPTMTICVLKHVNGFVVVGSAAPADPKNFDPQVGEKFAYEDAVRKLWPLEGFALRERMVAAE